MNERDNRSHAWVRTIPKRRRREILRMENALLSATIENPYTPPYHYRNTYAS